MGVGWLRVNLSGDDAEARQELLNGSDRNHQLASDL